jgi:hypothetical protein
LHAQEIANCARGGNLTPWEVEKLVGAARKGRYGHRDRMLILVTYRDDLRAIAVRSGMVAGEFDPPPRSTFATLKRLPIRIRGDRNAGDRKLAEPIAHYKSAQRTD